MQEEESGEITELVCNIDDMTPEALAFACSRLLELGALDVYTVPGTMKKGRSGHVLTVLCPPDQEEVFAPAYSGSDDNQRAARAPVRKIFPRARYRAGTDPLGRGENQNGRRLWHYRIGKPEYEDVAELARKHQVSCQKMSENILSFLGKEESMS